MMPLMYSVHKIRMKLIISNKASAAIVEKVF